MQVMSKKITTKPTLIERVNRLIDYMQNSPALAMLFAALAIIAILAGAEWICELNGYGFDPRLG